MYIKSQRNFISSDLNGFCDINAFWQTPLLSCLYGTKPLDFQQFSCSKLIFCSTWKMQTACENKLCPINSAGSFHRKKNSKTCIFFPVPFQTCLNEKRWTKVIYQRCANRPQFGKQALKNGQLVIDTVLQTQTRLRQELQNQIRFAVSRQHTQTFLQSFVKTFKGNPGYLFCVNNQRC